MLARRAGDTRGGLLPVVFTSVISEAQVKLPAGLEVVHAITETPQTWLDMKVYEADGGLGIDWDAPEALFPTGLLEMMLAAYMSLLEELPCSDESWERRTEHSSLSSNCRCSRSVNATAGPCRTTCCTKQFSRRLMQPRTPRP